MQRNALSPEPAESGQCNVGATASFVYRTMTPTCGQFQPFPMHTYNARANAKSRTFVTQTGAFGNRAETGTTVLNSLISFHVSMLKADTVSTIFVVFCRKHAPVKIFGAAYFSERQWSLIFTVLVGSCNAKQVCNGSNHNLVVLQLTVRAMQCIAIE